MKALLKELMTQIKKILPSEDNPDNHHYDRIEIVAPKLWCDERTTTPAGTEWRTPGRHGTGDRDELCEEQGEPLRLHDLREW